jgi:hypothetical protein
MSPNPDMAGRTQSLMQLMIGLPRLGSRQLSLTRPAVSARLNYG